MSHTHHTRVGPRMARTLHAVSADTWSSTHQLALAIGPNGSHKFGDEAVKRCIRAGLLYIDPTAPHANPRGNGAPVLTAAGHAWVA